MLSCQEFVETASDYIEQDMSWWRRLQLKMHLLACRHCQQYLQQIKDTIRLVRKSGGVPPPVEVEEALLGRFRRRVSKRATPAED
jgi:hypothetical protein